MKKIIIIEDSYTDQSSVAGICHSWKDDLEFFTATGTKEGLKIINEKEIDLIICNLSSGYGPQIGCLSILSVRFPYIPSLAITGSEQQLEEEVINQGAALFLKSPPHPDELRLKVHELLKMAQIGVVRNIPVHSMLQILEMDEKTCTLMVKTGGQVGLIFLENGIVIGAETVDKTDEDAIYTIMGWDDTTTEIRHYNGQRPNRIDKPLISLIMEAYRLKDEKDNLKENSNTNKKTKPEHKFLSNVGGNFYLEMGAKINMQVDKQESLLTCEMVGMVPDKFLIITAPEPADLAKKIMHPNSRIVLSFIHLGRMCSAKTGIMENITSSQKLLFLKYPEVIHFNELRKAKRTSVFVPVTLKINGGENLTGLLVDLSSKGCRYTAKVDKSSKLPKLDIDSEIELSCTLPGIKYSQLLHGKVKTIKKSSFELRLGIEFVDMADILKTYIEKYVQKAVSMGDL